MQEKEINENKISINKSNFVSIFHIQYTSDDLLIGNYWASWVKIENNQMTNSLPKKQTKTITKSTTKMSSET